MSKIRLSLGIAFTIVALLSTAALAQQTVTRVGPITPGDCASFSSPNAVQDAGFNCNGTPAVAFANPTGAVGLAVVNGSATTAMRSDAAPPLSASVQSALTGANGQLSIGTGGFGFAAIVLGGDCTFTSPNITCTKTNGVAFGPFATQATPCTIAQGCTGQTGQTAAFNALAPTPTRAGDITYWNGSNYVNLAGNNSGTQILSENASGVPSWSSAGAGSVTSVTCGTGLSGGTFTVSGTCAVNLSTITASLGADVALNNTANYFDGPSVAQGTSGTWWASGQVSLVDTGQAAQMFCKLWDGTTVIASNSVISTNTNLDTGMALSGYLATPAGNIRISCKDASATTGKILFNASGNSKDATISAMRIQ